MIDINKIDEQSKTPLVLELIHAIEELRQENRQLRDEIARLKQHKGKPKIPPSRLGKDPDEKGKEKNTNEKRPGSAKRSKTKDLIIHDTIPIAPDDIPAGSTLERYDEWIVQGLKIELHNVCYRLECWRAPDGTMLKGRLPDDVDGQHFDATLRSFILHQHHHGHVTQPLIWEQLRDFGVDISSGQVNRILTEDKDVFHREKDDLLRVGLDVSNYINVDDTGARHAGRNGFCTHIGNDLFAWFESTQSKSRINFLELLQAGYREYSITDDALEYIQRQSFPKPLTALLAADTGQSFDGQTNWLGYLRKLGIEDKRHVRIATEGGLIGGILNHGFSMDTAIISDDAGQFNVFLHALCWIHAERTIHKIIPCSEQEKAAIEDIRDRIWQLYRYLAFYKKVPDDEKKAAAERSFDEIFSSQTCSNVLNDALRRLANNKKELLLVLERPDIPLHNNLSERDIREYVKKRKISGGTRSEAGRRCRDTFTSLKKTCRKNGISFMAYIHDRVSKANLIEPLPDIIRARAQIP